MWCNFGQSLIFDPKPASKHRIPWVLSGLQIMEVKQTEQVYISPLELNLELG